MFRKPLYTQPSVTASKGKNYGVFAFKRTLHKWSLRFVNAGSLSTAI